MSDQARENILKRLGANPGQEWSVELPELVLKEQTTSEKVEQLKGMMEKVRTQVHRVSSTDVVDKLSEIVNEKKIQSLLLAKDTVLGKSIHQEWPPEKSPQLVSYESDIEEFKEELFQVDASLTSTLGGIAETGTLVLWPTQEEPRLMSLVPPIHIALLEAKRIYHNFREMMVKEEWNQGMPSNVLLISGPSKTGDIEFSLQYGVHGPKELIVLIVED